MQKRLDIACALLHDPTILILDEPTADLDPILRKQMWNLIRQINARGTTIILASHFLAEIELLCTRIALLHSQHIVEIGTADHLRELYSKVYKVHFRTHKESYSNIMKELARHKSSFVKAYEETGGLVIDTYSPEKLLPIITNYVRSHRVKVANLNIARPTLGEIFEAFVRNEL
jgi:ABC-2 type transport system ATP-binding protein